MGTARKQLLINNSPQSRSDWTSIVRTLAKAWSYVTAYGGGKGSNCMGLS
jgi:hypothetical protein